MKRVLLSTPPLEVLIEEKGLGGTPCNRTDTFQAWTSAHPPEDQLSVSCPPIGLRFLKENVPDVEILEYPTWSRYREALASGPWDMVGLSFYTWATDAAIRMAEEARSAGVKEIWAGNYGVLSPGLAPHFTRLVKGPGEHLLHQYVYGKPLPAVKHPVLTGMSSFRGMKASVGYLYSKRGCNIGCTFCCTPVFNPREDPLDMASLEAVLDVYKEQRIANVIIYDETFLLDNDNAGAVMRALAKRELTWTCMTRADRIRGRVSELTDLWMEGAIVGIESFRDSNLADVHKRDDVFRVRDAIRELNRHGRRALGTFILGFEGDTPETLRADIEQLAQEDLYACQLTLLTPFPGTNLERNLAAKGYKRDEDLSLYDVYHMVWDHPAISRSEGRELLAWAQRTVNKPELIDKKMREYLGERLIRSMAEARKFRAPAPKGHLRDVTAPWGSAPGKAEQ